MPTFIVAQWGYFYSGYNVPTFIVATMCLLFSLHRKAQKASSSSKVGYTTKFTGTTKLNWNISKVVGDTVCIQSYHFGDCFGTSWTTPWVSSNYSYITNPIIGQRPVREICTHNKSSNLTQQIKNLENHLSLMWLHGTTIILSPS